jgi:hypothetical protein
MRFGVGKEICTFPFSLAAAKIGTIGFDDIDNDAAASVAP